ncbi:MAG TPA: efflux RND transporter periplasmic adaptor subunit [Nitrospiraceae bacterium]|jgi:multidrug efflux system membrane fusion protein|nr:efflux RND transporter periplasmic adaptor subunit [Nitrospiraceae bacterium]
MENNLERQRSLGRNLKCEQTVRAIVFFSTGVLFALLLSGCSGGKKVVPKKEAVPVAAATVIQKTVPVQVRAIGNVEAYSTVGVKSQIGGELARVHFREGQDVNEGDLLFTIDPRPYEAALQQAEANLAKDMAQLENAREEVRRYAELVKKGYVAQEQYDQIRTNSASLDATVNADNAAAENARLQLKYCYIYSPINGRLGSLMSNQGNLIKANADTSMVVINQILPIYVTFSVPEQYLAEIKKYMALGKVTVQAVIGNDAEHPETGELSFVDNAVDVTTGTIKLKATFVNKDKRLWPGQFVNAIVTLTTQPNAIVVPSQALQVGQDSQYVFVVKSDLTVESRPVVIGRSQDGEVVIEKGLKAGETVVTDGQLRLVPGTKVVVKTSPEENGHSEGNKQ